MVLGGKEERKITESCVCVCVCVCMSVMKAVIFLAYFILYNGLQFQPPH